MKTYRIFVKGGKNGKIEDLKIIKEDLDYLAFIFNVFYLFFNKLWKMGLLFLFLTVALLFLPSKCCSAIGSFIIFAFIAVHFVDWKSQQLAEDGYEFFGIFSGNNEKEAKEDFLKKFNENYTGEDKLKQKIF